MAKQRIERSKIKAWAKENYHGLENCLLPTFNKDFSDIDEDAIRHDVRQSIKHGFTKTIIIGTECNLSVDETKKMAEIVVDEANGQIFTSFWLGFNNLKIQLEMLRFAENVGADVVLMHYPESERFESEDDVFEYTKRISDATDLPIDLYGSHKYNFERFHPSRFSAKLIARIAELENIAGYKEGIIDFTHLAEVFAYCGDNLLPMCPADMFFPVFITKYGMQWAGGCPYEVYQDTENRQIVTYFQLLQDGKWDEAMEIYWQLQPVRSFIGAQVLLTVELGSYNFNQWKYFQWLVGGSGGRIRLPSMKLYERDKIAIKNVMIASGITVREDPYPF